MNSVLAPFEGEFLFKIFKHSEEKMNPVEQVQFQIHQNRGTGRTYFMANHIENPEEQFAVLVSNFAVANIVHEIITKIHPSCHDFIIINLEGNVSEDFIRLRTAGLSCPIYFDNSVLDQILVNAVKSVNTRHA